MFDLVDDMLAADGVPKQSGAPKTAGKAIHREKKAFGGPTRRQRGAATATIGDGLGREGVTIGNAEGKQN